MCESCRNGGKPIAAIWARVSTSGQMDLSPETQVGEVKPWLEEQGYIVPDDRIIKVHWTSQEVLDCPAMRDTLLTWVRSGEIHAIGVIHDDRVAGTPGSKVIILDICQRHGVKVLSKHSPIPDGWVGELVAYLNAVNKRNTVTEMRTRVKQGLRDRAKLHGLPVSNSSPYGYRLRYDAPARQGGKRLPVAFEPDPGAYPVVAHVWQMAMNGEPIRKIARTLVEEGVAAPKGGAAWSLGTIHKILTNPVYGGRHYALRYEAQAPKRRQKETYGNSSQVQRPREDWHLLDFPIVSPVVSWPEWESVQDRLRRNKSESRRNSKRTYLLSGMLFCGHDGRRLFAYSKTDTRFYYRCTLKQGKALGMRRCEDPKQYNGPAIDSAVWETICAFLSDPHTFMAEIERRRGGQVGGEREVEEYVKTLQRKLANVDSMETELVGLKLRHELSDIAYERSQALLKAERSHYNDELERQRTALATLSQSKAALDSLEKLRNRMVDKLASATLEDRRWALQSLGTRVVINGDNLEISIGCPGERNGLTCEALYTRAAASST